MAVVFRKTHNIVFLSFLEAYKDRFPRLMVSLIIKKNAFHIFIIVYISLRKTIAIQKLRIFVIVRKVNFSVNSISHFPNPQLGKWDLAMWMC